ncbi:MAG: hypothetical protein EXR79_02640 [Myxococcales bacterium]|nr:hypothetical protein [Myxococcales bacterium]
MEGSFWRVQAPSCSRGVSAAAAATVLILTTCDDETPVPASLADVLFQAGTTDEALAALLDAPATTDPTQGPAWDAPTPNAVLPKSLTPTFRWHRGPQARGPQRSVPPGAQVAWLRPLGRLVRALAPVQAAWAHGASLNGTAHFLELGASGKPALVRVFTANGSWTPPADVWAIVAATRGPITARLTSAVFEADRVAPGGGPWVASPVTFTVGP